MENYVNNRSVNRVQEAIQVYAEQEAHLSITNPVEKASSREALSLKWQYYRSLRTSYHKQASAPEKLALRFVRHEMAKIRAQLRPTLINKIWYSPAVDQMRSVISGNNRLYQFHQHSIANIQREIKDQHNLQTISEEMKKAGFRFEMEGTLKRMIQQDLPTFHVRYADIQNRQADFVLHFQKIPGTDRYYFSKFDAIARPSLDALLKKDPAGMRMTFPVHSEQKWSAREAASLVNGKSVHKPLAGKEAWMVLDANGQHQPLAFRQVEFDLDKALHKLPIKNIDHPTQYKSLTETLKSGIQKEVTMVVNGMELKYNIEVNAVKKAIQVSDKNNRPVPANTLSGGITKSLLQKLVQSNGHDEVLEMPEQPKRKRSLHR